MLILLLGSGTFATYQVMSMEDQLDEVTQAVDKMEGKVKQAQHEKAKFYAMARDVLRLAPTDPNAEQVAVYFKLRELKAAQPELMAETPSPASSPMEGAPAQQSTSITPDPITESEATNAASLLAPSPTTR
jgi:hypothetical protein